MRIKSLKLKNFGSYKDAEIDFTKVNSSPIVIITGDTGSGKSTILDGIVFSLYQTMFRYAESDIKSILSSLSNQSSASSELMFSLDSSQSDYLIKRTIASSNGSNSYSVEISRKSFGDNQWLRYSDTKTKLDEKIEKEILKCSHELFIRSFVLPQGQFASLLKTDDPGERRKIIMEIFSEVKIYDKIKELINKKYSEVEKELGDRRVAINHIKNSIKKSIQDLSEQGVDVGDISKFDQEFDQDYDQYLNDIYVKIDKKLKELETSKQGLERERDHKQKVLQTQKSELYNIEQVLKDFRILERSRENAVNLVKSINSSLLRSIGNIDTNILNAFASGDALDYSEYIDYVRGVVNDFRSRTETNRESLERIITQYEVRRKDYQNILDLEQKFVVRIKNDFRATKYKGLVDSITSIQDAKSVLEQIYNDVQTELQSKNKELQSLKDERLDEKVQELGRLKELLKRKRDIEIDIKEKSQEIERLKRQLSSLERELKEIDNKLEEIRKEEIKYFASRIKASLKEGDTCPVCGGVYHGETRKHRSGGENILGLVGVLDSFHYSMFDEPSDKHIDYADLSEKIKQIESDKAKKEKDLYSIRGRMGSIKEDLDKLSEELKAIENELTLKGILTKEQFEQYEANLKKKREIERNLENEIKSLEFWERSLKTYISNLEQLINDNTVKRQEIERWKEDTLDRLKTLGLEIKRTYSKLDDFFCTDLYESLVKHKKDLEGLVSEMTKNSEDLTRLEGENKTIQNYKELANRDIKSLEDNKVKLEASIREIEEKISSISSEISKLDTNVGGITQLRKDLRDQHKEFDEGYEALKEIQKRYDVLKSLSEKFDTTGIINYVVRLKMSKIAENVNRYLVKLGISDKVLEVNFGKKDRSLSFSVRHLVSDKVRSINSLSGGESFLFSVALAFAVANDILQHLDIKSMFIDEGFDTLDEAHNTTLFKFLEEFATEKNITIYIITHKREIAENTNYPRIVVYKENGVSKVEIHSLGMVQ